MRVYWLIGAVVAVVVLGGVLLTRPHYWARIGEAKVTYRDRNSPQSAVYRSSQGHVLVAVNHSGEQALYVVETSRQHVGMPNRSAFYFLPGFVYSKNMPPLCAPMGKAAVIDPQLIVEQRKIEFTSFEKARVSVAW